VASWLNGRAVRTARTMSSLVTFWNWVSCWLRKAQMGVSGVAPSFRSVVMRAESAFTGQHGLGMAQCAMICPRRPFFWLSMRSRTRSGNCGFAWRVVNDSGSCWWKNATSCSRNCCVRVVCLVWFVVYSPTRRRKKYAIRQSSPVARTWCTVDSRDVR